MSAGNFNHIYKWWWWYTPVISVLRRQRQEELSETNLVYTIGSKLARDTQRNLVSINQNQNKKTENKQTKNNQTSKHTKRKTKKKGRTKNSSITQLDNYFSTFNMNFLFPSH